jgi:serine/threonine protein kinase
VDTPPLPPSRRSELDIPPSLEDVVMACLEKDRRRRPSSAEVLARQFSECDVGEPWSRERADAWWRAHLPDLVPDRVSRVSEPEASALADA